MQIIPRVSECFASPMSLLPCLLPIQRIAIRNEEDGMLEWVAHILAQKTTPYAHVQLHISPLNMAVIHAAFVRFVDSVTME